MDLDLQSGDFLFEIFREINIFIALIMLIIGSLQCFFGYKLFKFWIAVTSFAVFGILGGIIGNNIASGVGTTVFFALMFAVLGAWASFKLYLAGVFLVCGSVSFVIGYALTQEPAAGIIMGLALGILATLFVKPVVILSTSLSGGASAGLAMSIIFGTGEVSIRFLLCTVFIVLGIIVQYKMNYTPSVPRTSVPRTPVPSQPLLSVASAYVSAAEGQAAGAISFLKDSITKQINEQQKNMNHTGITVTPDELSTSLQALLCKYPFTRALLPFSHYVLFITAALNLVYLMPGTVLLLAGLLCFANKKYGSLALAFTCSVLFTIYKIGQDASSVNAYIELLVFGAIAYCTTTAYFQTGSGLSLKSRLMNVARSFKSLAAASEHKPVAPASASASAAGEASQCQFCGTPSEATAKFCGSCGHPLTGITRSTDQPEPPGSSQGIV